MQALLASWRTTITGLVVLGLGAYLLHTGEAASGAAMITAGLGLVAARDSTVSSEQAGLK